MNRITSEPVLKDAWCLYYTFAANCKSTSRQSNTCGNMRSAEVWIHVEWPARLACCSHISGTKRIHRPCFHLESCADSHVHVDLLQVVYVHSAQICWMLAEAAGQLLEPSGAGACGGCLKGAQEGAHLLYTPYAPSYTFQAPSNTLIKQASLYSVQTKFDDRCHASS